MVPKGSLTGQRFGNYIAHRVLGRGGMGTVYLAEHPEIGRKVAIKVVSQHDDEELIQRFLAEAKAVNKIGHPNIIDIYDFGRTESGRLYYVMEYLAGRELGKLMGARKRMNAEEVMPYLAQLCAAMQAAHDNGVVHRDLKPANIFILDGEQVRLKVLDFGVAKLLDRPAVGYITTPGALIGTPMFGAPEQLQALADKICPQTDLYSIGVIVFWMLTGRPPYMADNNAALMAKHVEDPVPSILEFGADVPPAAAEAIERCLAKQPRDRPRSASALAAGFRQAVHGRGPNEEPALVFGPIAGDGDDDVSAHDLANVSTLVEAPEQPSFGSVVPSDDDEGAPLAGDADPETQPARKRAGLAKRGGAASAPDLDQRVDQRVARPDDPNPTSTTVETGRAEVMSFEPPDDERAQRPTRPITGPLTPSATLQGFSTHHSQLTRPITGPMIPPPEVLVAQPAKAAEEPESTDRPETRETELMEAVEPAPEAEHAASISDWSRPQPPVRREGRLPTMQRLASPPKPSFAVDEDLPPEPPKTRALRLMIGLLALALLGLLIALALK